MSKQHDTETRLDAAIDSAVRQMMAVDPRAGFRQRVLARLDRPAPVVAWWPRFALAGAALAAIVLAVVLLRPAPPANEVQMVETQPPAAPVTTPASVAPDPDVEAPAPVGPTLTARTPAPKVEKLPDAPRVDNVFGTPPDGRVAAANAVDPPAAPPVEDAGAALPPLAPIEIPAIEVPPIEIKPLTLTPLTPPVKKEQESL